ncbi:MAG: leucine-rich repeat domain-containing protein [Clostridia bacterium]|nr:leucine-rich repeat domain-containing protein [Clostridia bacterium]
MNNQYGQKEQALIDLCGQTPLDMERFTLCLKNGVDVNASLGDEENLLLDVLWELIWHKNKARIIDVIHLFLDAGFDTDRFGYDCLERMGIWSGTFQFVEACKAMLKNGVKMSDEQWKSVRETFGTEESFNSVEGNHAFANNSYAAYEIVDGAWKKKPFDDILPWECCVGLKLDHVFAAANVRKPLKKRSRIRFQIMDQLQLQCGDQTIVVMGRPNLYIRKTENLDGRKNVRNVSRDFEELIGKNITHVYFRGHHIQKNKTGYQQPEIYLKFENGEKLCFSTNFGCVPKKKTGNFVEKVTNEKKLFEIFNGVLLQYRGRAAKVMIPEGVTEIGRGAFYGNQFIREVVLPDAVKMVGEQAFSECRSLETIQFNQALKSIQPFAFRHCIGLETIHIPGSVNSISFRSFLDCTNLRQIIIEEGVKRIGPGAFSDCISLREITFPASLIEIDHEAFVGCRALRQATFLSAQTEIGWHVFANCNKDFKTSRLQQSKPTEI